MGIMKFAPEALKNLFKPPVTTSYPFKPAEYKERTRGHIEISIDDCIGCGMCARNCPAACITVTDYTAPGHKKPSMKIDPVQCVKCGTCISACRFKAIEKR